MRGGGCTFRQCLGAAFTVFSLPFITLVGCNSGSGVPVQVGEDSPASNAQDQITDLHYASPEEFWLSNPGCNENTIGVKAYVGEAYPYTCVLHGNEWMWTKVCEHNGLIYIEGESWFEGENCGRSWYLCKDGNTMKDPLGRPGSCGYSLSSSSSRIYPSSSSQRIFLSSSDEMFSSSSIEWSSSSTRSILAQPCRVDGIDNCQYGTLVDERDGQSYKTVLIGTQTWMAENLNYYDQSLYAISWCYNHRVSYCDSYGRLYTWTATMDSVKNDCGSGSKCSPTLPVQGVCPSGWHLPSNSEFEELFEALGGKSSAGEMLKSQTAGWSNNNFGKSGMGSDAFGFSALPIGFYYRGDFSDIGKYAYFWSSTENDEWNAYYMGVYHNSATAELRGGGYKSYAFSIRCLKD